MTAPTALGPPEVGTPIAPDAPGTKHRWDVLGLLIGSYAFLVAVAWSNRVFNWFIVPKAAVSLCVLGPGLVALAWLFTRRDLPAMAAAAFLTLATLATATAGEPAMSLTGEYFALNGLIFLAVCVGVWALGRTARGRTRFIDVALLAGATVNAAVAWLQASTDLGVEGLGLFQGRAQGLTGNPVFLAGLCTGALCLALAHERNAERPLVYLLLGAFLTGAIELSGSRISVAVAFGVVVWFVVGHVRRRAWPRAGLVLLAVVAGFAIAQVPGSAQSSSAQRVSSDASSGLAPRVRLWQSAIEGLEDRPLLGYGPGRSEAATSPRRSLTVARYEGPDILYSDVHNFLVEELTATGLLGFAAFLAWLVLAGRRIRGPLAGFAAVGAITMLLEPQNVGLTPLVLLAFGAAGADAREPALAGGSWVQSRLAVGVSLATIAIGAAAGVLLISGDMHYRRAVLESSFDELSAAASRFPPWPELPGMRAQLLSRRALNGGGKAVGRRAIEAERSAIERDSDDPHWWYALGALEERFGTLDRSASAYRQALRRNPWSETAMLGLFRVAIRQSDHSEAVRIRERLCRLGRAHCPPRSALNQAPDPVRPSTLRATSSEG